MTITDLVLLGPAVGLIAVGIIIGRIANRWIGPTPHDFDDDWAESLKALGWATGHGPRAERRRRWRNSWKLGAQR